MCGIAGFVTQRPSAYPDGVLQRMTEVIHHRGPDAGNFYRDEYASLGHRRLSIIDLSTGHQPMANESGDLWIIYNGEIFNHGDIRPELEAAGHRYKSHCDTEALIHSYEQYGPACLERFRGMFAFAMWDRRTRTLFCARDRLGIKPFYYFWNGETFVFGSEIKALLEHPAVSVELEDTLLAEHLAFGYSSDDRTLFRNVRKLMPGHWLTLRDGKLDIQRYWDVPRPAEIPQRSDEEWIAECRQRLETTVRMRLMSDVPLGMFLSGGVDSSAIAALMKRMVTGKVKTFSVGYREAAYSELSYAAEVAKSIGTEHNEVVIGMDDFFNSLPRLIWHEDEPIVWPSSVSLYFVSKLASEQVKVVLTGEGSDEMFGGYSRYRFYLLNQEWLKKYRVVPKPLRNVIRNQVASSSLLSATVRRKLQHTFVGRGESLESLYIDNFYSAFAESEQKRMANFAGSPYETFHKYWQPGRSLLSTMLYADQKTYLVELLMKQDQMSMACSIESRVPFLDHPFVEFSATVPDHMKIRGKEGKYILKKAVEDLLPHDIIYRTKMGFPTPLRQWLLEPRAETLFTLLRDRKGVLADYLNMAEVDALITRHRNGVEDATDRIWRLLNLQVWGEIHLKGNRDRWWEGLLAPAKYEAALG
jgi:asparagine synthase (glutamine-hydrolysing)